MSCRRRPISVDLPSSTEPTMTKRNSSLASWRDRYSRMSLSMSSVSADTLKIPFALFLLHRRVLIVVDEAALPLGDARQQHLADDLRQRRRRRLDRARQRIAAERAEANHALLHDLAGA